MKKELVLIIGCLLFTLNSEGQNIKAGGGIAAGNGFYFQDISENGSKSSNIAFYIKGVFDTKLPVQISPSFLVFLPNTTTNSTGEKTVSAFMFDINCQYIFAEASVFQFYGIGGFNILYSKRKTSIVPLDDIIETDNSIGLNLGVGSSWNFSEKFSLSGEAKYIAGKYGQFLINLGVLIKI